MPRGKKLPRETIFAAQLPCNPPHSGGIFRRRKKMPSLVGERQFGKHFKETIWLWGYLRGQKFQKRKISPKTEVFGRTSLRTSGRKLRSDPPNPGKTSILARTCRADVHEKNFGLKKLRADFSFPKSNRPALSGGMDWWRREWPFSRVRKLFFRGRNLQQNPGNTAEKVIFAKLQAPKFEISEPEKMQFHTPSHSIPPLDSLLLKLPRDSGDSILAARHQDPSQRPLGF